MLIVLLAGTLTLVYTAFRPSAAEFGGSERRPGNEQESNSNGNEEGNGNEGGNGNEEGGVEPTTGATPTVTRAPDTAEGSNPSAPTSPAVPSGYVLDPHCEKGPGSTGLDIYYLQAPSDSLRFACVHRTDTSPYIDVGDAQYAQYLADVGGPYCAYSTVSENVGCALEPITEIDLMNVPPQQAEVPAGYVLEDCQQGTGATGKTIYFRPPLPPEPGGRMHTYWFECVHREGSSAIVNVVSSPSSGGEPEILGTGGPYCAFSTVSENVGCALEPITSQDLMNPS